MSVTIGDLSETELTASAGAALLAVLRRTHLSAADDLTTVVAEEARRFGVRRLVLHLVDYEQTVLVPVPGPDADDDEPLSLGGTVAGRAFTAGTILDTATESGRRVWLPLIDGTERLGVVAMDVDEHGGDLPRHVLEVLERYAHFVASVLVAKDAYSDLFKLLRRRQPMTTASELLHEMVPPSTLATVDFVLGSLLAPTYDIGGDAYDYALNRKTLHLGIFDGVGHGLAAAGVTTFALAVYRHARRRGDDLPATYRAIDTEVARQYPDNRYVTACLAQLDVRSGRLRWMSAGHPAPLLLRRGRFVKELEVAPSPPLGLRFSDRPVVVGDESLEPGDMVLFYTDGLTESRRPDGRLFTTERLAEFIERQAGSGEAAPETLRRLREAIVERGEGTLRDDATAMLLEWRRDTQGRVLPETVVDR